MWKLKVFFFKAHQISVARLPRDKFGWLKEYLYQLLTDSCSFLFGSWMKTSANSQASIFLFFFSYYQLLWQFLSDKLKVRGWPQYRVFWQPYCLFNLFYINIMRLILSSKLSFFLLNDIKKCNMFLVDHAIEDELLSQRTCLVLFTRVATCVGFLWN